MDEGPAGTPMSALAGNGETLAVVHLHGTGLGAGDEVIVNSGGVLLGDNSGIEGDREHGRLEPSRVGCAGQAIEIGFTGGRPNTGNRAGDVFLAAVLEKGGGEDKGRVAAVFGQQGDIAVRPRLRGQTGQGHEEGDRADRFGGGENQLILEGDGLDAAAHVHTGEDVGIDDFILQVIQDIPAQVILAVRAASLGRVDGEHILGAFHLPGQEVMLGIPEEDGSSVRGGVEFHLQVVVGAVSEVGAAGSIGHGNEGIVNLLPLAGLPVLEMHLVGKQDGLVQVSTQVEDFSDPGTLGFGFPAGKTLHFFGCHRRAERFFLDSLFLFRVHDGSFLLVVDGDKMG